jgi:C4-dicarboxylate-specific signal transduction histidine kinase
MAAAKSRRAAPSPSAGPRPGGRGRGRRSEGRRRALRGRGPRRRLVRADPEQLHRIAVNLLRNAREAVQGAGRTEGRVEATAQRRDGLYAIRFTDDGPGLPERTRARLFQPFTASSRAGGAGLGLAISRELAQANAGELALLDTGPTGATFELLLPAA